MKILRSIVLSCTLLLNGAPTRTDLNAVVATCYGRTPCNACSNCSKCKHCSAGGSCGTCTTTQVQSLFSTGQSKTSVKKDQQYVGQCKALTKKGARCKRNGDGSGYCWQHAK